MVSISTKKLVNTLLVAVLLLGLFVLFAGRQDRPDAGFARLTNDGLGITMDYPKVSGPVQFLRDSSGVAVLEGYGFGVVPIFEKTYSQARDAKEVVGGNRQGEIISSHGIPCVVFTDTDEGAGVTYYCQTHTEPFSGVAVLFNGVLVPNHRTVIDSLRSF